MLAIPAAIITVGLLALTIREEKRLRLRICISALAFIAAAMHANDIGAFSSGGSASSPEGRLMLASSVLLLLGLSSGMMMLIRTRAGDERMADAIHRIALYGIPIAACIIFAALLLFGA